MSDLSPSESNRKVLILKLSCLRFTVRHTNV